MSYDLFVYLNRSNMPSPKYWKSAIIEAGFPVELDSDFDVESFTGFLPCSVRGQMSGFEYYSGKISKPDQGAEGLPADLDFQIQFNIGSQPLELVSAAVAAGVLAKLSNGVLLDPQEDQTLPGAAAVEWAKNSLEFLDSGPAQPRKKPWWRLW